MPEIHPLHYAIRIEPDLDRFEFKGQVTIQLQADRPSGTVILNVLELAVWQCRLSAADGWIPLPFCVDPSKETLTIQLPEARNGLIVLRIDYQGIINDKMSGFYRSRSTHAGRTHHLAVTQFQESSARQAFPCMDHPVHKAVFELTLSAPRELTVLANTLPLKEELTDPLVKRVTFEPTPRMSTYLLFFGLGPFELAHDTEDDRVRLAHLPGLGHTTELGLAFGRKALQYCEAYYDIAYPLAKMDLIAVPDFAFGAMENWGAITFRENLLLHFPELTSKAGVQRICEVIAHEIAHQWFGNLVTPADWKYLWLNESFATYFGYGVVAYYHPQWGIWEQFLLGETATALIRDGLRDTIAIEIPGGEHVVINSSTAPIIYNKGASIMRMIQGVIGMEAFQQGVRRYLRQHRFDCARSHHLWEAFESASSQPITAMMQSWIEQPGHPLITVARDGDTLMMRQKRFTYLDDPGAAHQTWSVPITLTAWTADDRVVHENLLMQSDTATIVLPADTQCYKINREQSGFYRVRYEDEQNLAALGRHIHNRIPGVEDRWGIQNDLYALVRRGSLALDAYLDYLDHYVPETEFLPLASMAANLMQAMLVAPSGRHAAIAGRGRALVQPVLERIGCQPAADELQTTTVLREQVLWQGALWRHEPALAFGMQQFERLVAGRDIHPDIAKAVMQIGAWTQGESALNWLCGRFEESPSEHERMNVLSAMGTLRSWPMAEAALAFNLEKVPPRNRFIPIVAMAANPEMREHLWPWYQSNLKTLEGFHPLLYERVITAIIPYGGLDREEEVQTFGKAYIASHPHLTDAMRLALENLAVNVRMRSALQDKKDQPADMR
jgi:aminopeptidase N